MNPREVPIPLLMRSLERDPRGYPIFFNVMRDKGGTPHFVVNDHSKSAKCLKYDLCGICGKKHFRGRWFVGGTLSAFHKYGAYLDPPMHYDCAHYALKVCPWLSMPNYRKSITEAKTKNIDLGDIMLKDQTSIPGKPECFVAVMATEQEIFGSLLEPRIKPKQPYKVVEFWRDGVQLSQAEGFEIARRNVEEYDKAMAG